MKLYELKKGAKFRVLADSKVPPAHRALEEGEVFTFNHIDGMYSLCFDKNGGMVHVVAWAEVEEVK